MTPDELKKLDEAIRYCIDMFYYKHYYKNENLNFDLIYKVIEAARTLSELYHGTHKDLVVVPKEPTREMCIAGHDMQFDNGDQVEIYKAMIAAARKDGV